MKKIKTEKRVLGINRNLESKGLLLIRNRKDSDIEELLCQRNTGEKVPRNYLQSKMEKLDKLVSYIKGKPKSINLSSFLQAFKWYDTSYTAIQLET